MRLRLRLGILTAAVILLTLLLPLTARAQSALPVVGSETLTWDQPAPDLATVQSYDFTPIVDSTEAPSAPAPVPGVSCAGAASPFVCKARLPALQTGLRVVRIMTSITVGSTVLAAPPSLPLSLLMYAVPVAAQNLRLEAGR